MSTALCRRSIALLAAGLVACAGTLEDPERFDAPRPADPAAKAPTASACDVTPVLAEHCTSCHSGSSGLGGLALDGPSALEALRGKPAKGGPGLLVDVSSPRASVVYTKLTPTPPFGGIMPPSKTLDPAAMECVLSWLDGLAAKP